MKLLIIEDFNSPQNELPNKLGASGYSVDTVLGFDQGMHAINKNAYEIIIINQRVRESSHYGFVNNIRNHGKRFPIIILADIGHWQDAAQALDSGADAYLVNPVTLDELDARIKALVRRCCELSPPTIKAGVLMLDVYRKQVDVEGVTVKLTASEYRLLEYLVRNSSIILSKSDLIKHLHSNSYDTTANVIEVLIGRLRRKLSGEKNYSPIQTVKGEGYVFSEHGLAFKNLERR